MRNSKNPCWFEWNGKKDILKCVPYFYIAGVPKAGTSDLFNRVRGHPSVMAGGSDSYFWWDRLRYGASKILKYTREAKRSDGKMMIFLCIKIIIFQSYCLLLFHCYVIDLFIICYYFVYLSSGIISFLFHSLLFIYSSFVAIYYFFFFFFWLLCLGEPASVWHLAFYTDVLQSPVCMMISPPPPPESAFSAHSLTVSLQPPCA